MAAKIPYFDNLQNPSVDAPKMRLKRSDAQRELRRGTVFQLEPGNLPAGVQEKLGETAQVFSDPARFLIYDYESVTVFDYDYPVHLGKTPPRGRDEPPEALLIHFPIRDQRTPSRSRMAR